ncbi:hypothetical protein Ddye_012476 [Dipteronia dyeriana]|uniref:Transposase MuDR plant domain-containing protein n=1 Tax=Dipteronia dyeriana TaxID=168575 RepID=A0AAD9X4D8_9ROSI|nr:hypothetical protein Ddye_012476 [Dipteronia dyeriana]
MGNCYEGGMTKWVNVPICVSYDGLVKLVEDVVKVDVARYNLQLWSLVFTIRGTIRQRIENDNDVSCMMNVDKLLPEEGFEVRIRRSRKTRYEAGCKDGECDFHLRGIKMQKEEYWVVRMFVKDHTCNIDGFHARIRQANSWTVGELLALKL